MNDHIVTVEQEIQNPFMGRPHVVILGAGASVAAFPDGDCNGRKLPVMNDLAPTLGLSYELDKHGIAHDNRNFEDIYSDLHTGGKHPELIDEINEKVTAYFSEMKLTSIPSIYDHLVLSLRPKDVIATFNWDPFLYDACLRNYEKAPLPKIYYLHGNVRIGYCLIHKRKGLIGSNCSQCSKPFTPSKLLFPIKQKNYSDDPFLSAEWDGLRHALKNAFVVTIFGYGAPKSDTEAVGIMKLAWGEIEKREFEEIEIIDIRNNDDLRQTWSDFIHTHHYETSDSFYDSWIAKHPRRTCEGMWNQLLEAKFVSDNNIPVDSDFPALHEWYMRLIEVELAKSD